MILFEFVRILFFRVVVASWTPQHWWLSIFLPRAGHLFLELAYNSVSGSHREFLRYGKKLNIYLMLPVATRGCPWMRKQTNMKGLRVVCSSLWKVQGRSFVGSRRCKRLKVCPTDQHGHLTPESDKIHARSSRGPDLTTRNSDSRPWLYPSLSSLNNYLALSIPSHLQCGEKHLMHDALVHFVTNLLNEEHVGQKLRPQWQFKRRKVWEFST